MRSLKVKMLKSFTTWMAPAWLWIRGFRTWRGICGIVLERLEEYDQNMDGKYGLDMIGLIWNLNEFD